MLVELKDIYAGHDKGLDILKGVNLCVNAGEFVYLIGKVGSGKSTILKVIDGELGVRSGSVNVCEMDLVKLKRRHFPKLRREMGIVFQDFKLLKDRTIGENLHFALKATGWNKKQERITRIEEVMTQVELHDKLQKFPHELSGGEQQRVAIARALLNHPRLILADEPTGNLDMETTTRIMTILHNIKEQGTAVVMVTHNQNIISEFPGTVYLCEDGVLTHLSGEVSYDCAEEDYQDDAEHEENDYEEEDNYNVGE